MNPDRQQGEEGKADQGGGEHHGNHAHGFGPAAQTAFQLPQEKEVAVIPGLGRAQRPGQAPGEGAEQPHQGEHHQQQGQQRGHGEIGLECALAYQRFHQWIQSQQAAPRQQRAQGEQEQRALSASAAAGPKKPNSRNQVPQGGTQDQQQGQQPGQGKGQASQKGENQSSGGGGDQEDSGNPSPHLGAEGEGLRLPVSLQHGQHGKPPHQNQVAQAHHQKDPAKEQESLGKGIWKKAGLEPVGFSKGPKNRETGQLGEKGPQGDPRQDGQRTEEQGFPEKQEGHSPPLHAQNGLHGEGLLLGAEKVGVDIAQEKQQQ